MKLQDPLLFEQAQIFKALGHPSRLLIVETLRGGPRCVCELQALVGSDLSTVSKHLSVLRQAGIVTSEKKGTSIYYRLAMPCLERFLSCLCDIVEKRCAARQQILDDALRALKDKKRTWK